MDNPCKHCDKADIDRSDYFKCDEPCNRAKQCYECEKELIAILRGANIESVIKKEA